MCQTANKRKRERNELETKTEMKWYERMGWSRTREEREINVWVHFETRWLSHTISHQLIIRFDLISTDDSSQQCREEKAVSWSCHIWSILIWYCSIESIRTVACIISTVDTCIRVVCTDVSNGALSTILPRKRQNNLKKFYFFPVFMEKIKIRKM